MKTKRLLVDGQVFQTGARDRGMGRYAISLLRALQQKNVYEIEIILSENLPLKPRDMDLLPGARVKVLNLKTTEQLSIEEAIDHNRNVVETYVATLSEEEIHFFVPSLFQEPTVAVLPRNVSKKTILCHDIIPYLYHERYRRVMQYENYLKRFRFLFEADLIFTNSQTVTDDLTLYLGIQKDKMCRIDGAAIKTDTAVRKPAHIDTSKKFILFNTSDDPRKNNLTSVQGFEELLRQTDKKYALVITSDINEVERKRLQRVSGHLIFTGNIPQAELNWLYDHCEALLCTPESEGLGLMVLEAVEASKKVVCSSISVFQEISEDAFYYCNHEDSKDIARALGEALASGQPPIATKYRAIQQYYSWEACAGRMVNGLETHAPRRPEQKLRIAVMTATPSALSGVGITSALLHPVLSERFEVEYYFEQGLSDRSIRPNYLQYVAPCYAAEEFSVSRYGQYDAVVYHLGNGEYHLESIKNALYLPGYIIVHDTNLREAYRVLREAGMMSEDRVRLEERIDDLTGVKMSSYYSSIANRQLGVLVHSDYAEKAIKEVLVQSVLIKRTGLPIDVPERNSKTFQKRITIGLAGAIADVKGLAVIKEIAQSAEFAECDIRLFGFNHAGDKLTEFDAYPNVSIATNISDYDFQTNFAKLNIFMNYRMIYKGETSNTTLEAMRQGVTTIVRNVGWFGELDNDVVVKVESVEEAIQKLRSLVKDVKQLQAIGRRAKEYVAKHFAQRQYVDTLAELITESTARKGPNTTIAHKVHEGAVRRPDQLLVLAEEIRE